MAAQNNTPPAGNECLEIVNTRVFSAPREKVFDAFAQSERIAAWWGPKGFTNTNQAFDFRPGGRWQYVMHAPDGANYENESEFVEIARPERILLLHLRPMHRFHILMTFEDAGADTTRLTWRMMLERNAENEKLKQFLADANEQNFDRLRAFLEQSG